MVRFLVGDHFPHDVTDSQMSELLRSEWRVFALATRYYAVVYELLTKLEYRDDHLAFWEVADAC